MQVDIDLEQDIATFWSLLFAILNDSEKRLASHMAAHDLTPPQFFVLKTLVENGGSCPIGFIARDHHLTNATMTGLVKRLEAMSPPLVERQPSPDDGRSVVVVLTIDGEARFEAVKNAVYEQLQVILGLIGQEERQTLMHFATRYLDVVSQLFPIENLPDTH